MATTIFCLTAIFQDNPGKPIPECLHYGFYWSKNDGGGDDNWSCKTCNAAVKSSPHSAFYRPDALPIAQLTTNGIFSGDHIDWVPHRSPRKNLWQLLMRDFFLSHLKFESRQTFQLKTGGELEKLKFRNSEN